MSTATGLSGFVGYLLIKISAAGIDLFHINALIGETLYGILFLILNVVNQSEDGMISGIIVSDAIFACLLPLFHSIASAYQILSMRMTPVIGKRGVGVLVAAAWVLSLAIPRVGRWVFQIRGGVPSVLVPKVLTLLISFLGTVLPNAIVYRFIARWVENDYEVDA